MKDFSCLISVYSKEKDTYLNQSLQSIREQTLRPSEVVLVEDGPLGDDLHKVINQFSDLRLKIIKLKTNQGLGIALREGVLNCSYDIVARMDTDDIAEPRRFEKQIEFLEKNPQIDVLGSWILESDDDFENVCSMRILPVIPEDILKFAKVRNPLNHMTVVFRKSSVLAAGNYQPFPMFEDYYLWVRMLGNGCLIANLPEYLVKARIGPKTLLRRRGLSYALTEIKLQSEFFKLGFINFFTFAKNVCVKFPMRVMPLPLFKCVYFLLRYFTGFRYSGKRYSAM